MPSLNESVVVGRRVPHLHCTTPRSLPPLSTPSPLVYVGIGFVALPMDCFNAFRNRPKVLSLGEARQQRKQLLKRSEELMRIGEGLASGIVEFSDEMRSKKERRKRGKARGTGAPACV